MTDLTDAEQKLIDYVGEGHGSEILAALNEAGLRAVVAAHPTGPDQDEVEWLLTQRIDWDLTGVPHVLVTRENFDRLASALRARGAQATAPAADEDDLSERATAATQAVYAALDRTDTHGVPDLTAHAETYARLRAGWQLVPPAAAPGAETTTDEDARVKHQMTATRARARGDWDAERAALDQIHLLDLAAARRAEQQDQL